MLKRLRNWMTRFVLENPNLPLNSPGVWEQVFGESWGTTSSGESMTHEKALQLAAVWQAVNLISGDVAKLPLNLYMRKPELGEDARDLASSDPVHRMVRYRPNEEQTAVKFWRRTMVSALLWGNAYVYVQRSVIGEPMGLVLLLPDKTRPERINNELIYLTKVMDGATYRDVPLPASDVLHIEGISTDGKMGVDTLKAARESWALGLAQEKFSAKFFNQGGRFGGILELPAGMPKPVKDTVEEGFRKTYESTDASFKTIVLRDNAKFHPAQANPKDMQLNEAGQNVALQVARWFNLPPSKLGLPTTTSYNGKEEESRNYLDSTLSIWLSLIAEECNAKLLTEEQQGVYFFEHNTSALLRTNTRERYEIYQLGIAARILSPNECRAKENMLPYEGGDTYENPNTTSGSQETMPAEEDAPEAEAEPTTIDDEEEQQMNSVNPKLLAIFYELARQAERRAERGGKSFCSWIDHNAPDMREKANEWIGSDKMITNFMVAMCRIADSSDESKLLATVTERIELLEQEIISDGIIKSLS